jgi:hypothetical protein
MARLVCAKELTESRETTIKRRVRFMGFGLLRRKKSVRSKWEDTLGTETVNTACEMLDGYTSIDAPGDAQVDHERESDFKRIESGMRATHYLRCSFWSRSQLMAATSRLEASRFSKGRCCESELMRLFVCRTRRRSEPEKTFNALQQITLMTALAH